jgi:UDP:flavonoid glycosyltransferase YjiC (YdhE family)
MEAVRNGVPVLCWPYFCDQFLDRSYVTEVWRTGLAVSPGGDGVVTKEEVKSKVEKVIADEGIRERAMCLKDTASKCISKGGLSHRNFTTFVDLLSQRVRVPYRIKHS